ncbi:MAG: UDP-3-O-(3-hydroxymyristoyl)glucosamine N-acyltransferase [Salinivirgaceae bacterium]|jgi:UDP-3-O-[3-hydroxymyristoyl] glucosamine N-acyltransferase|nr:UDP-3-O-(3-hydroxymyristoyl)glucosamine N-acyltransferase [Salinivirgaceae bacterium]
MEFSANQIAEFLKGRVEGDGEVKVSDVAKIEDGKSGTLAFLANPKYTPHIYNTNSSAVLVNNDFKPEKDVTATLIYVDNAYEAFATLLEMVAESMYEVKMGIEQPSHIHESCKYEEGLYVGAFAYIGKNVTLGKNVKIYPQVYVGDNVTIGDNTILYAGAKVYHDCILGKHVTIHSGAIIGSDGFGFAPTDTANYKKIPQIGNAILEDYVEVGGNTTVDRATMGSTILRKGVKLDNLIQIAHNVEVGESTVMAAQSGIAGSSKVGRNCMVGGQVAITGHITVADDVKLAGKSGVSGNIRKVGAIQMGAPSFDIRDFNKSYVYFRKLPLLNDKISALEKELAELKKTTLKNTLS